MHAADAILIALNLPMYTANTTLHHIGVDLELIASVRSQIPDSRHSHDGKTRRIASSRRRFTSRNTPNLSSPYISIDRCCYSFTLQRHFTSKLLRSDQMLRMSHRLLSRSGTRISLSSHFPFPPYVPRFV